MNINVKGTRIRLTEADQAYIEDKVNSLGKLLKDSDKVFVEAEVDKKHKNGEIFRVEVSVNPPKYYAESFGTSFYEAMDLAVPKIKEQLARQKDKKVSSRRAKKSIRSL